MSASDEEIEASFKEGYDKGWDDAIEAAAGKADEIVPPGTGLEVGTYIREELGKFDA